MGSGEKERERNIDVWEMYWSVASRTPPAGDLARKPVMCPDWESNQWSIGLQASTQPTEPHQPVLKFIFLILQIEGLNLN